MFGLLMDYRSAPDECSRTPTEGEWQVVINNVEKRLSGLRELKMAGQMLTAPGMSHEKQMEAAQKLGQVRNKYHVPFARRYLLEGLKVNMMGYGPVQTEVLSALERIGGDLTAIPYLMNYCSIDHTHVDLKRAKASLNKYRVAMNRNGSILSWTLHIQAA